MSPADRRGSFRTDLLVALVVTIGSGAVLLLVSGAGWIATRLSTPVLIVVAVVIGVAAGLISARRKPPVAEFTMKRPN